MTEDEGLKRVLGPFGATAVVVGGIIGVGIFFTPRQVMAIGGSSTIALLAWVAGGLIALAGALTFAEIGRVFHRTGGQYAILRKAWSPLVGFLYVICNATAIQTGAIAVIALVCVDHLATAVNGAPLSGDWTMGLSISLIGLVAAANMLGARWGAGIQNFTVVTRVLTLLLIGGLAFFAPEAPPLQEVAPLISKENPLFALFSALVPVLFAFGGWQQGLWLGGEVKDPERQVPRAILRGVLLVVAVYLCVNVAYLRLLGADHMAGQRTPLAEAAVVRVLPVAFGRVVAFLVALSAFGVLNAQLFAGPRLLLGLARDGRFFAPAARVHKTFGTPVVAIAILMSISCLLLLLVGVEHVGAILSGVVLVDGVFFMLTAAAIFRLKDLFPRIGSRLTIASRSVVPLVFLLGEGLVILGALLSEEGEYRQSAHIGLLWILGSMVIYGLFFSRRSPNEEPR